MISIITCTRDPVKFERLRRCYENALRSEPCQMIGIPDAASVAEGYNRGVARSKGETIIFSHDDIQLLSPDFEHRMAEHLRSFDLLGIAGATKLQSGQWIVAGPPYVYGQVATPKPAGGVIEVTIWNNAARCVGQMKAMDGVLLIAKRHVAETVKFDQQNFDGFHLYDIDFTFRAYCAGHKLAVCCDLPLLHESIGTFDGQFELYEQRFLQKHGHALDRGPQRIFRITTIEVMTPAEALEVMTPPHWNSLP